MVLDLVGWRLETLFSFLLLTPDVPNGLQPFGHCFAGFVAGQKLVITRAALRPESENCSDVVVEHWPWAVEFRVVELFIQQAKPFPPVHQQLFRAFDFYGLSVLDQFNGPGSGT